MTDGQLPGKLDRRQIPATTAEATPTSAAHECTVFVAQTDDALFLGQNVDVPTTGDGRALILINKRERRKTPFQPRSMPVPSWCSQYGSVTMTAWGKDFALAGMNETGLVVATAGMPESQLPPLGAGPRLQVGQWNQYLLDTCESVPQVLQTISAVEPIGHFAHYLFADAAGRSLVVDFLDGKARCYRGESLPWPIIVNCPYAAPLAQLNRYAGFGGDQAIPEGLDNTPRLARIARALRALQATGTATHEACFAILKGVSHEQFTKRSVVYDIARREIRFKTILAGAVKLIRAADLDFSPGTPTLMLDMHTGLQGDVTDRFVPLTTAANTAVAEDFGPRIIQSLRGDVMVPVLDIPLAEMIRGIQEHIRHDALT